MRRLLDTRADSGGIVSEANDSPVAERSRANEDDDEEEEEATVSECEVSVVCERLGKRAAALTFGEFAGPSLGAHRADGEVGLIEIPPTLSSEEHCAVSLVSYPYARGGPVLDDPGTWRITTRQARINPRLEQPNPE
ncbi:unnamed protein product [Lampetra planeri]